MYLYKKNKAFFWCAILLPLLMVESKQAISADGAGTNMNFHGTLVEPPPCSVNNNETIHVSFGEVGVNKVNGKNYLQPINYQIKCEQNALKWEMVMMIKGQVTAFDSSAIQTSATDLGIRLLLDGKNAEINKEIPIDPKVPPLLQAVPVAKGALIAGGFDAFATLYVAYQ
ncbi:fimbrial protein [Serratia sp. NPDC078593]|uniref:fimbrial protein n=1 Tax=unclassified Serratia (in: enterobacteria) TaxID=2647522 RepID=UPI0037D6979D